MQEDHSTLPLTELAASEEGVVAWIADDVAGQVTGFGIYPGVTVRIRQKFPSLVIQTEETELALEEDLARRIRVRVPSSKFRVQSSE